MFARRRALQVEIFQKCANIRRVKMSYLVSVLFYRKFDGVGIKVGFINFRLTKVCPLFLLFPEKWREFPAVVSNREQV